MEPTNNAAPDALQELVIKRIFGAPRDLVFKVWTDPEHVARWWGPRLFTIPRCELDARPGGKLRIDMQGPDGLIYPDTGVFEEVVPPERLVFLSRAFEQDDGNALLEVRHTITFEEFNGMTQMTLRAVVIKVEPEALAALAGMEQGWSESLYKLSDYLDTLAAGSDQPLAADTLDKVIIDITMSLDGFVTGPNDGIDNGLGDGGRVLHEWVFEGRTEADNLLLFEEPMRTLGSCVLGRRTFDIAEGAWGDEPPFGAAKVFVLTHRPHETLQRGATTFIFVTAGLESALAQARAAAGGKNVNLMGAAVSQQYLQAGLVDELEIHVANVLLGAGRPLFAHLGAAPIKLERTRVIATPAVTHLHYRVVK